MMAECVSLPCFMWRIQNFTSVQKKVSPPLYALGLMWQLRFTRFMEEDVEKIRLILECLNVTESLLAFKFRTALYFVYDDATRIMLSRVKHILKNTEYCLWTDTATSIQNTYKSYLERITFSVTVTPVDGIQSLYKHEMNVELYPKSSCVNSLIRDLGKLFNNDECSDFVLKCGEKSFYVHKAVLTARSDFFAGMFRSNMKEVKEETCKIEDVEPDILELVLRYIYTGEVPEIPKKSLQKIYAAADRFSVESLKVKCYSLFVDDIILSPEDDYDKEIKTETLNVNKSTEVVKTESQVSKDNQLLKDLFESREWRSYSLAFPDKAQEICKSHLFKH